MWKWFTRDWWSYLLAPINRGWTGHARPIEWLIAIRCRMRGHKAGVVWYNPGGFEPDMTCKNCGDDLG